MKPPQWSDRSQVSNRVFASCHIQGVSLWPRRSCVCYGQALCAAIDAGYTLTPPAEPRRCWGPVTTEGTWLLAEGEKEKAPGINRSLTGRGQKKRNDLVLRGWRTPLIFMLSAGAPKNRDSGLFCACLKTFSFNLKESCDSPVSQMRCWWRQHMFYKVFVCKDEKKQGKKDGITKKKR